MVSRPLVARLARSSVPVGPSDMMPPMLSPLPALAVGAALLAATLTSAHGSDAQAPTADRRFTLFYTAEVHGTVEPCGCTSDPLGDVARYASVVRAARKAGEVLLVDAGGLSSPEGGAAPRERAGNELRARFLANELGKLGLRAVGLADTDLAAGTKAVRPARLATNLAPTPGLASAPSMLQAVNGVRVGVVGVVDPAVAAAAGTKAEDPVPAVRREADRLRRAGAEIVIALPPVDRPVARRLAREAAVDFVVLGPQGGAGAPRADALGGGLLLH